MNSKGWTSVVNLAFISNYFNHHQKPLSDAFYTENKGRYFFLSTVDMGAERRKLGWKDNIYAPYVYTADGKNEEEILQQANVVIAGSAPEMLIQRAIRENKLIFRYSERPLKAGGELIKYPIRFLRWHYRNPRGKPIYLLCASAFTAGDYAKFGLFRGRCYKWGYFPETIRYPSIDDLIDRKAKATILWCGRFLGWKHPDDVIEVAKRLRDAGCCFKIEMIGTGEWMIESYETDQEVVLVPNPYYHGDAPKVDGYMFVQTGELLVTGDFAKVKVTGALEYDLIGELADEYTE